jgi:hypothetical protein
VAGVRWGMPIDREEFLKRYSSAPLTADVPPAPAAPGNRRPDADDPVRRMSGRVLAMYLKNEAGGEGSLFGCLDILHTSIDEILPVAQWLEARGFVTVSERPRTGDWKLKLTQMADKLIG